MRFLFSFWQVVLPLCWIPRPEYYFHHGASCAKVWEPVTFLTGSTSMSQIKDSSGAGVILYCLLSSLVEFILFYITMWARVVNQGTRIAKTGTICQILKSPFSFLKVILDLAFLNYP